MNSLKASIISYNITRPVFKLFGFEHFNGRLISKVFLGMLLGITL